MDERSGEFTRTASGRHWVFPRLFRFAIFLFMEFDIGAEHARLLRLTLPRFSFSPEIDISAEHVRLRRSTLPFFSFLCPESSILVPNMRVYSVLRVPFGSSIFFPFIFFYRTFDIGPGRTRVCHLISFFWNASGPQYARGGMSI